MLIGIDPLLSGQLLLHLDRMGHSDLVVVADAHFPAHRLGPAVVEVAASAPAVVRAVRTVTAPDDDRPLTLMDSGADWNDVQREIVAAAGVDAAEVDAVDRFEFYALAASAQVIVRTAEVRTFGNAVLRKGVTPRPVLDAKP